jgi:lipoprotein-anchoring transpeptidase ErfK/SrfK
MSKIGYNFNGGKQAVKARRKSSGGRYLIIFIILMLFCGGTYFMFFHNNTSEANKPSEVDVPQSDEKITISELKVNPENITPAPLPGIKHPQEDIISAAITTLCEKSAVAMNNNEYVKARQLALEALKQSGMTEYSKGWIKAAAALSLANSAIISSDVPLPGKKVRYKVEKGDALQKIAKKFNTTVGLIQLSNNMKKTNYVVWEGQGLKIYHGDWKIIISKKHHLLSLYDGNELFKIYRIGIGRQDRTPECQFTIVAKKKNPAWYKSKSEIIPFGTKENVLGTRWIALKASDDKLQHLSGYGIHGTWDNDSIGKSMSNGCIRMKNPEVEELFSIVPYRTTVIIGK